MESISLKVLSSLVEDIHIKTQQASQNTDLDMREFLGIDKALQSIQGELLNNTSKLAEIDKRIKIDTKKLEEVQNGSTYIDKQRQLYRDRLEILSQNRDDLSTQVARIRQTIGKVLDRNTSLVERIRTLFCEQGITIFSILTALSMTISIIVFAIIGIFGVG